MPLCRWGQARGRHSVLSRNPRPRGLAFGFDLPSTAGNINRKSIPSRSGPAYQTEFPRHHSEVLFGSSCGPDRRGSSEVMMPKPYVVSSQPASVPYYERVGVDGRKIDRCGHDGRRLRNLQRVARAGPMGAAGDDRGAAAKGRGSNLRRMLARLLATHCSAIG